LIQGPTGVEVLVDGGPSAAVLSQLGTKMPFWDRSLDAIVATHPDADHVTGLTSVLDRYVVGAILESGVEDKATKAWANFVRASNDEIASGATHVRVLRGTRLNLGGGAYADVLYPDRDVAHVTDTNEGSVVLHVVYGASSFMLTGDAPQDIEEHLVEQDGEALKSAVLKAGHHGSKGSSALEFLAAVAPEYGVFSRGCNNRYGHPAPETMAVFKSLAIPTFDTCLHGTITFHSDGMALTYSLEKTPR
jgi:competence protein ComEC